MKELIEEFYSSPEKYLHLHDGPHIQAVEKTLHDLNLGKIRVAEKKDNHWITHEWIKKAILLYFRTQKFEMLEKWGSYDKIPLKKWSANEQVRVVPGATARYGAFVAPRSVLMPCYVNIGAYVDEGTMVDTWATVGSCAQIGKNCHLSGGVGIGGVLEPPQAAPVIIEDGCFLGSRAIVVEGVHVGAGCVLGANVVITASTPIIDVRGSTEKVTKGSVPPRSVVIPGTRTKKFPAGEYNLPCALIIGERSKNTDEKTSLNQTLREFEVPV